MNEQTSPRWINIALGTWVFLSASLWAHSGAQYANALVIGAATLVSAVAGLRVPPLRYINVALGIWLFVSSWVLSTSSAATMWNHLIASIAILIVAMHPSQADAPDY